MVFIILYKYSINSITTSKQRERFKIRYDEGRGININNVY